jgi:hypothetical protein
LKTYFIHELVRPYISFKQWPYVAGSFAGILDRLIIRESGQEMSPARMWVEFKNQTWDGKEKDIHAHMSRHKVALDKSFADLASWFWRYANDIMFG